VPPRSTLPWTTQVRFGSPLKDGDGRVVGAVSVSVPDLLLNYEQVLELLPDLLATANAISAVAAAPALCRYTNLPTR